PTSSPSKAKKRQRPSRPLLLLVSVASGSMASRRAKPGSGRRSQLLGGRSRNLALAEVEDQDVELAQALGGEGPLVRPGEVLEHPLLPLGVDEAQSLRVLVGLDLRDE